jgi:hypothetical protein
MKSSRFLPFVASVVCLSTLPASAERFVTTMTLTRRQVQNGKIVATRQTKAAILSLAGQIAGVEPRTLELVYDTNNDGIEVVKKSDGTVVLSQLTFSGGLAISNTADTNRQRQTFVKYQGSSTVSGSAAGNIIIARNPDLSLKRFAWTGSVQMNQPAGLFNPDFIITGTFATGKKFVQTGP